MESDCISSWSLLIFLLRINTKLTMPNNEARIFGKTHCASLEAKSNFL